MVEWVWLPVLEMFLGWQLCGMIDGNSLQTNIKVYRGWEGSSPYSRGVTPSYRKVGLVNVAHSSGTLHAVLLKIVESNQILSSTRHCVIAGTNLMLCIRKSS